MKLELYSMPNCNEAEKIKEFLNKHSLIFSEIVTLTPLKDSKIPKNPFFYEKEHTVLKIIKSSSIGAISKYNEFHLNQLIEHIKEYKLNYMFKNSS